MAITILVTLHTPETDLETLKNFYRTVQPAGMWGRVARAVTADDPGFCKETPFKADLLSVSLAVPWLVVMYTTPVLLVMGRMRQAAVGGAILLILTAALWKVWWPNLPKATAPDLSPTDKRTSIT
jgi:hypothetical protein